MTQASADNKPSTYQRCIGWCWSNASWLLWVYWLLLLLGTHRPKFEEGPPEVPGPLDPVLQLDKVLHFFGFGGLMAMLVMAGLGGRNRSWAGRCGVALAIASGFALIDEMTQHWVPGRELDWTDILANLIGILTVYILALLPWRKDQVSPPRGVVYIIIGLIPAALCLMLFPTVIQWIRQAKHSILGGGLLSTHPNDYIFHGVVATIVSVLLIVAWPMTSRRPRVAAALALLTLLLSAPLIEIAQHFTGRHVEAADARAHIIGVAVAMVWWAIGLNRYPHLRYSSPPISTGEAA